LRRPTVAGQFYPNAKKNLKRELNRCFSIVSGDPGSAIGAIVPHAGYTYSGTTAAYVYAVLPQVDIYIILGPNHTGLGSMVAVSQEIWSTPFGEVPVDMELAGMIAGGIIDSDETAHRYEHSIEVQLPFLQYLWFSAGYRYGSRQQESRQEAQLTHIQHSLLYHFQSHSPFFHLRKNINSI